MMRDNVVLAGNLKFLALGDIMQLLGAKQQYRNPETDQPVCCRAGVYLF